MKEQKIELPEHDCLYETTNDSGFIDQEPAYRKSTVLRLIEADRQRRGEPVAWRWSESNGERWFGWTTDWSHHDRAVKMGCLIEYAAPSAPQPAEPVKAPSEYELSALASQFMRTGTLPTLYWFDSDGFVRALFARYGNQENSNG